MSVGHSKPEADMLEGLLLQVQWGQEWQAPLEWKQREPVREGGPWRQIRRLPGGSPHPATPSAPTRRLRLW